MVHSNELFKLDNDIKSIKERIKILKKKIYRPVEKTKQFSDLIKGFQDVGNQKHNAAFRLLLRIRNKELCRFHGNTKRLVKINTIKL